MKSDEKCYCKLNFKDTEKEIIYENNEKGNEQLDEENLINFIIKKSIEIILNKIKNEGNENALYKLIDEGNISETFLSQFFKCVMDSIPILLENKNKCYAMQTRSQLKNSKNISNNNEDSIKNKSIRNVEVTNKVKKKRGMPRKIIPEIKLQEPIKKRGRPRKVINKSPENDKKHFVESEDESDSDPDYEIKQKPKANKKRKHFKEDKKLDEGSNFGTNSDLSSEDEKEEIQENFQNVENEKNKERPDLLEMENSKNSDEDDFTKERPPPEPPPDQPSTSGLFKTQKNIMECRDQLTMRKDNYAYFVSNKGEPRDVGSKLLEKCGKLPNLKNLEKGIVKELRKGHQYHFALPIEDEFKTSLGETTKNIKLTTYSLHSMVVKLILKSISIAKSRHINNVLWEEILATLKIAFLNSPVRVIICIGTTQYPTKEQRNQLIEEAHSSAIGGHKGVTKTYNRIKDTIGKI